MRWAIAALALGLAACDSSTTTAADGETQAAREGYTMEVRAMESVQTYIVTTPDGRTVGARASGGASALLETARAQAFAAEPPPEGEDLPEVVSIRLPGFQMAISGTEENTDGDNGSVNISIGGEQNVVVRANEGGPGDADDTAFVRITGADAEAARDFVNEAEELSPEVKAQMLTELGL